MKSFPLRISWQEWKKGVNITIYKLGEIVQINDQRNDFAMEFVTRQIMRNVSEEQLSEGVQDDLFEGGGDTDNSLR